MTVLHHLALVLAVAALVDAAARVARASGARGLLETVVVAAPLGAAAAGAWALALGLVALGGSAIALLAATGATWAASRRLPRPAFAPLGPVPWALGAALGVWAVWVAWLVKHPALAIDPLTYHLPESVMWVQKGTPGSVEQIQYEFPQGNYPVTNELLVSWLLGLGRSFAPALLWTPALGALLAAAGWLGLRRAGVGRARVALAIAGVLLVPVAATQFLGPHTDLPALAWLATCAAIVAVALPDRPLLLAPALVAAGLALGTKTTVAPLVLLALAAGAWPLRHGVMLLARPLAGALLLAGVVGGTWYVRNLVDHGSPLWPFVATPWGDPLPRTLDLFDVSFLDRPAETLEGRTSLYFDLLGGGIVLLAGGLLAPLARRARVVLAASGATLLAVVAWANAPFTGAPLDPVLDLSLTTTRYLVPAIAAGAAATALAAERRALTVVLVVAALFSLERALALPFPGIPSLPVLAAGAIAGALTAWVSGTFVRRRVRTLGVWRVQAPRGAEGSGTFWAKGAGGVAVVAVAAAALSVIGDGIARRHGGVGRLASSGVVLWMSAQPAWREGEDPVSFAPQMLAVLAGDDLRHDIVLIPRTARCDELPRGWIVVGDFPFADRRESFTALDCLRAETPLYRDRLYRVYFRGPVQTATRSKARSTPSDDSEKSSGVIASARGSATRRLRVSSQS